MREKTMTIRMVDGEIDEVIAYGADVHLERMDYDQWSLIIDDGEAKLVFLLNVDENGRMYVMDIDG